MSLKRARLFPPLLPFAVPAQRDAVRALTGRANDAYYCVVAAAGLGR